MRQIIAKFNSRILGRLWADDCGALLATEWVVVATIMVLGIIPGLVAIRQGTLSELVEYANSMMGLDQSYGFSGQTLACGDQNDNGNRTTDNGTQANAGNGNAKLSPVALSASRLDPTDKRNPANDNNRANAGNNTNKNTTQAYTAGSGAIEGRHFDRDGDFCKVIKLTSTEAKPCDVTQKPCD